MAAGLPLKLKKWDNCYTFVLKYFGVFEILSHLDSDEFLQVVSFVPFTEREHLVEHDVLVFRFGETRNNARRIDANGRVELDTFDWRNHFVIYRAPDRLYDVTVADHQNYIRERAMSDVDLHAYTREVYVIGAADILSLAQSYDTGCA